MNPALQQKVMQDIHNFLLACPDEVNSDQFAHAIAILTMKWCRESARVALEAERAGRWNMSTLPVQWGDSLNMGGMSERLWQFVKLGQS